MELVSTVEQLKENILTLNAYAYGEMEDVKFHHGLIKNGKWIAALRVKSGFIFAPSRFVGYARNSKNKHLANHSKHGTKTNRAIKKIIPNFLAVKDKQYSEIHSAYLEYCQKHGILPSAENDIKRKYWLVNTEDILPEKYICDNIEDLAKNLNMQAKHFEIGDLQSYRAQIKSLQKRSTTSIFRLKPNNIDDWKFHAGGRDEIQFNIGFDQEEKYGDVIRHGLAFSLETSQTLSDISVLFPKIDLFNEYVTIHAHHFEGLSMWHYEDDIRSVDYTPCEISSRLYKEKVFIFVGRKQSRENVSVKTILNDFDVLFDCYKFVESKGVSREPHSPTDTNFFRAGFGKRKSVTVSSQPAFERYVNLTHNLIQRKLCEELVKEYPTENVGDEIRIASVGAVDVVVKVGTSYHFYEIKTAPTAKACIREALGQIMEYSYWPKTSRASKLFIVGQNHLDADGRAYLIHLRETFNLPIYYRQIKL